ncbi:S9 family peptidase [Streptomyces sp. SID3343]|uniref:S9 family peptidase n=1 Tax=Streptomyces sp. SID3343 TaxID=2690260 RepID=UPI0013694C78|nr:S9 family peptidase [Streptomyces sp. SID3343]MYW02826.1 prolyl oligopeptidase family serine peptidase [Streptomyces sp. SID3343]
MPQQVHETDFHTLSAAFIRRLHESRLGLPHQVIDLSATPDATRVVATGSVRDTLSGPPRTAVYFIEDGDFRAIVDGVESTLHGRFSPNGRLLSFLSDRKRAGIFQLHIGSADRVENAKGCTEVDGTVEYTQWSPTGGRILLGVAGVGADIASTHGGTAITAATRDAPAWCPTVDYGTPEKAWRSLWIHDVENDSVRRLSLPGANYWESAWCGENQVVAVSSPSPDEDSWYRSVIVQVDVDTGAVVELFRGEDQLGVLTTSPDGARVAFVQALCSDRGLFAGNAFVMDLATRSVSRLDVSDADLSFLQWIDAEHLGYFGIRHLESVAGIVDIRDGSVSELPTGNRSIAGSRLPRGHFLQDGSAVVVQDSYTLPHEVTVLTKGGAKILASTAHDGSREVGSSAGRAEAVSWTAPDGLTIEGIVCLPPGEGPFPTVLNVHGGPVWIHRESWMMKQSIVPFLVSQGFAVFCPNPRGSCGRGQAFARKAVGDFGGAEVQDHLSGIDHLVNTGIADPARLGVMGGSHGGYIASWIVTQDDRFAAAVPFFPVTDWYSWTFSTNIPSFGFLNLDGSPEDPGSAFHMRSPVTHASSVRTPCLTIGGSLDKCTPAGQAVEFHNALRLQGVESALCIYPNEGHGIRGIEAEIDFNARILDWFASHFDL